MNPDAASAAAPLDSMAYAPHGAAGNASTFSAVSWPAIFAGAVAAAALSLILLILGTGLGLSAVSPWAPSGISAATFGVSVIVWITVTQVLASGMGGYLAGRLRSKWVAVHNDEVYFRDTVHGFLAWALASLVTAAVLASATGAIVGSGVQASATVAGTAVTGAVGAATAMATGADKTGMSASDAGNYFIDSLFRQDMALVTSAASGTPTPTGIPALAVSLDSSAASVAEVSRIFFNSVRTGALPPEDARHVGQVVAQRTGLSQADAEKRVNETFTRMQTRLRDLEATTREAADKSRKASAYAALWVFISLLTGAFVASLAATLGGRQRDVQMHSSFNV